MSQFTANISNAEPMGFLVYIQSSGDNLSMAQFSAATGIDISEILKLLTSYSGFNAEPPDAMGFFIFENYAQDFAQALLGQV